MSIANGKMAQSPAEVEEMLIKLKDASKIPATKQLEELKNFANNLDGKCTEDWKPWDNGYYRTKQEKTLYDLDDELLRPYFPLSKVRNNDNNKVFYTIRHIK